MAFRPGGWSVRRGNWDGRRANLFGINRHGAVDIEELLLSLLGWDLKEGDAADLLGGGHICGL